jgi:hypothetical protein
MWNKINWRSANNKGSHNAQLDYNTISHAQKPIFVYGRNGRVQILLQRIWGLDISVCCWQLVSALEWFVISSLTPLFCFLFTSTTLHRFVTSHNRAIRENSSVGDVTNGIRFPTAGFRFFSPYHRIRNSIGSIDKHSLPPVYRCRLMGLSARLHPLLRLLCSVLLPSH